MSRGRYSGKMLLGSIIMGIVYGLIGELLIHLLQDTVSGILLITVYFVLMFLFFGMCVWFLSKIVYSRSSGKINKKHWALSFAAIVILSVLFEFLYELQITWSAGGTSSYIFLIDASGSMAENDPDGRCYDAMANLLEKQPQDFRYAVYTFDDQVYLLRNMERQSANIEWSPIGGGGTSTRGALESILNDIKTGTLLNTKKSRLILLTDGLANDISSDYQNELSEIIDGYNEAGISIYTIGLIGANDEQMTYIAEQAGGSYIHVDDVENLDSAMEQAGEDIVTERDLLNYHDATSAEWLFALMRILFIALLGIVIGVQKMVLCERFLDTSSILYSSVTGSVLAGLLIELGLNAFGFPPFIIRVILCMLIAFMLLREALYETDAAGKDVLRASY